MSLAHRYGDLIPVGLGHAEVVATFDVETYSEDGYVWNPGKHDKRGKHTPKWELPVGVASGKGGLFCVNAATYTAHPSAELLTLTYDLRDGQGKRRWRPGLPAPLDLFEHIARGRAVESHYAGFEFWVWNNVLTARHGWPLIPLAQQRCSMAKARAFGLPGSLAEIGRIVGAPVLKDADGKRLLDKFSKPRNPSKGDERLRIRPDEDPLDAEKLYAYCDTDVDSESAISERIPDLDPQELSWWFHDQAINRLGVQVDIPTIRAAKLVIEQAFERYNGELYELTNGAVERASELQKLGAWMADQGHPMYSMDEDGIASKMQELDDLVTSGDRYPQEIEHVWRALEIRQLVGSAAVKKLYALDRHALESGRVHELFTFHGARTGRATGNGPQPTNLPNSGPEVNRCVCCGKHYGLSKRTCPWCLAATMPAPPKPAPNRAVVEWCPEAAEDAIEVIGTGSLEAVELFFDNALGVVSACLRGMFVAADGHDLISADYSAIEAVVLAELAGEQWRIELFRNKGKIYEASGAKVAGLTYDEVMEYAARTGNHHPVRKKGKVMELALGYQGWVGAMKNFGADAWMTDDEMKAAIVAWRNASPMIVEFWGGQYRGLPWAHDRKIEMFGLEGMAIMSVLNPGREYAYRGVRYQVVDDVLYCTLLSGRRLSYHRPRLRKNERDKWGDSLALSFEGWNSNPKKGAPGWVRMDLYGGLLCENVVQATARDILVAAIIRLWHAGYPTVLHVYDEIAAEIAKTFGSREEFCALMGQMPEWARHADGTPWPIWVGGFWRGKRYRK